MPLVLIPDLTLKSPVNKGKIKSGDLENPFKLRDFLWIDKVNLNWKHGLDIEQLSTVTGEIWLFPLKSFHYEWNLPIVSRIALYLQYRN